MLKRPLKPKKMLKIGFHWVTANRGKPDASDLGATSFRRDRLRQVRLAKSVPPIAAACQSPRTTTIGDFITNLAEANMNDLLPV